MGADWRGDPFKRDARGARPRAERDLPRSLHGSALRPEQGAVHHYRQPARADPRATARPAWRSSPSPATRSRRSSTSPATTCAAADRRQRPQGQAGHLPRRGGHRDHRQLHARGRRRSNLSSSPPTPPKKKTPHTHKTKPNHTTKTHTTKHNNTQHNQNPKNTKHTNQPPHPHHKPLQHKPTNTPHTQPQQTTTTINPNKTQHTKAQPRLKSSVPPKIRPRGRRVRQRTGRQALVVKRERASTSTSAGRA